MADLTSFSNGETGLNVRTLINNIVDKINTELVKSIDFDGTNLLIEYVNNTVVEVPITSGGSGGGIWGGIIGTITNQTDLVTLVNTKEPIKREIDERTITFESDATGIATFTGISITLDAADYKAGSVVRISHQAELEPTIDYGDFSLFGEVKGTYYETTPAVLHQYTFICREIGALPYVEVYIQNDVAEATPLVAANNLSDVTSAATARTNLGLGTAATTAATDYATAAQGATADSAVQPTDLQTGGMSMFIETLADQDYIFAIKMPFAGTITETTTKCTSGTATATFKINTTALGGTANAVSSAEQSQAHASSNAFAAGDDIICTVSANSTCLKASLNIKFTYTLA